MGVELRRVPADWKHPTDHDYSISRYESKLAYLPPKGEAWRRLHDEDWGMAMREWWASRIKRTLSRWFWYWPSVLGWADPPSSVRWRDLDDDKPPEYWSHRPRWKRGSQTHYQLYETVSEGTPLSPVCASIDELVMWCAAQKPPKEVWVGCGGMTEADWRRFFERGGWAPSGFATPETGYVPGPVFMSREKVG